MSAANDGLRDRTTCVAQNPSHCLPQCMHRKSKINLVTKLSCYFVLFSSALPMQGATYLITLRCLSMVDPHPQDCLSWKSSSRGTFLEMEPMLKSYKMLTKMATKGPKGPTWELLANFDALWLTEFTRLHYHFWHTDTRAIGLCTVQKSALGELLTRSI